MVDATGEVPQVDTRSYTSMAVNAHLVGRDPSDSSQGTQGYMQEDGSFSLPVEPGPHLINFWHDQWQLVDAEQWTKKGIEVALGQSAEIELRLAPRQGGWTSLLAEARVAHAEAKGEPVPRTPALVEMTGESSLSALGEDALMEKVIMDWPTELLPKKPISEPAMLAWLDTLAEVERKTLEGEEQITSISFDDYSVRPDELGQFLFLEYSVLANINRLPHLESLMVLGAPGDDSWLEPLRGHQGLQQLVLVYPKKMTSVGMRHLASLPNLRVLGVSGRTLDDNALKEIDAFPKLETLQFGGMVTDAGIAHLQGNSKLKALLVMDLGRSKLTDESFRYAASMPNLEHLSFHSSSPGRQLGFTDTALKHLTAHAKLRELVIQNARITDDGLAHLHGLKSLKKLQLEDTLVTPHGVEKLKVHLPELEVGVGGSTAAAD